MGKVDDSMENKDTKKKELGKMKNEQDAVKNGEQNPKTPEEKAKDEKDAKKKTAGKRKNLAFTVLALLIIIGVGVWFYAYWQGANYFTTENAKVTADLRTVVPVASGRVVKLNVEEGSFVQENEVLGRLQNGSYLRSPIAGQVVKLNVVLNQMVAPTAAAAVIADTSNIYVAANEIGRAHV